MFKNIGNKIKIFAKVMCFFGIGISVVYGVIILTTLGARSVGVFYSILISLLAAGLLSLAAWVGSFTLYGLGQLIDNSDKLVKNSEKALIILNAKKPNTINNDATVDISNSTWTCSVCGCSVSHTYKTCPFCDYVNKSDHKHAK